MRLRPLRGVLVACALLGAPLALAQQPATGAPAGTAPAAGARTTGAPAAGAPTTGAPATGAPATGAPAETAQPATGAPAAGSLPPPAAPTEAGGYTVRLRHLERSVSELKEQVFRTKARLQLLKETVLGGVIGASRAVIRHRNEMGATFRLIKVVYALDGVQIFSKADDTGRMSEMQEFDIYNGAIQPGSHTLTVNLVYQGHGFGVFSYMNNMKFNVRSSNTFVASEGRATQVTVVGYEKGGMTTNMQDKPAVDFRVNVMAGEGAPTAGKK
jgi:hypothetical protein